METIRTDDLIDITAVSNGVTEHRSTKSKPAPKAPINDTGTSTTISKKKKKAPTITLTADNNISEHVREKEDDSQIASTYDREISAKLNKERTPKVEHMYENNESISIEEPVKKKKAKAPKPPLVDVNSEVVETPAVDIGKHSVQSKTKTTVDLLEDLKLTNVDETYFLDSEINVNTNDTIDYIDVATLLPSRNIIHDHEKIIIDSCSYLASKINFAQYIGNDHWRIIHLPKSTRTGSKSRIKRMLFSSSNKNEQSTKKALKSKISQLNRICNGVNKTVRDENSLIVNEVSNFDLAKQKAGLDGIDTYNLNHYTNYLCKVEDKDHEINPDFLVLGDGKIVYSIHESDSDRKFKLATHQPIYDYFVDHRLEKQTTEKKKFLSRLKNPFTRNKNKSESNNRSSITTAEFSRKSEIIK